MKYLDDLTRKQRYEYVGSHGFQTKYGVQNAWIKYFIENNSPEEIAEWLEKKALTHAYAGCPYDVRDLVGVYTYNRIHEFVHGQPMKISDK